MAASFKTQDGTTVSDGDTVTLVLRKGDYNEDHERAGIGKAGEPVKIEVTGTVRTFDHLEPTYEVDPDFGRVMVGKTSEPKWEISTDDPQHPAIGFLPENVLTRTGK